MFWFIERNGTYWNGADPQFEASWQGGRKGAIAFKTEKDAWNRIRELGIEDAQPQEY